VIDMASDIRIKSQQQGKVLGVAGGNYRVIISGGETGGDYAVIEMLVPPGGGPPPHCHPDTQEMFYVTEGEIEFKTEEGKQVIGPGGLINIPFGGPIHCFRNNSASVAKLLCTVMPAGLEEIFEQIGQPAAPGEFLPVPELTEERKKFLQHIDQAHNQKTYPGDYLD